MSDGHVLATLATLALNFGALSLVAVGGASAVLPEMHRQAVDVNHWMTGAEFGELFAMAQAAPGPNVLVVTLIGWKVAGLAGAVVATLAMCGPSCLLTALVTHVWRRPGEGTFRARVQAGLSPITVGLILATGYLLCASATTSWAALLIAAATATALLATRVNPLWLLAAAAVLGAFGWVPG